MTGTDWFGFLLTVFVFIVMVVVYFWVLNPKNKDSLESHRSMLIDEDERKSEKQDGR
ncbi:MAG TPA: CcoQ/FixQ family Cbb3-type cytochrome c oxidase assembly chaperone [Methylophaga sp.]|nr:CcoQ/FixQ family Cbb3-type cytochrome c oxidase assembly chaperone [Methylophaga sp.]HEC58112.1 CcoQ/FixQ family Cbb3-type cytochrome c oxidase assembly chaperone [Methylophaga sp.]